MAIVFLQPCSLNILCFQVFILASVLVGVSLAAPQNLVRLVPADLSLASGFRAIPADTIESHAVHTVQVGSSPFGDATFSAMTVGLMTFSVMTFRIITFIIMTVRIIRFSIMTLTVMISNIMTLSK
jgi:hypothetical protein